jgi:hypothetical protein
VSFLSIYLSPLSLPSPLQPYDYGIRRPKLLPLPFNQSCSFERRSPFQHHHHQTSQQSSCMKREPMLVGNLQN